jgi:hypothetical protein
MIGGELLDQPSDYRVLKKGSAPGGYLAEELRKSYV